MDSGRAPLVCELPDRVLRHVAALLDAPALHNWRSLVALVPGYSQRDVMAFVIEEQNVSLQSLSTSRALSLPFCFFPLLSASGSKCKLGATS